MKHGTFKNEIAEAEAFIACQVSPPADLPPTVSGRRERVIISVNVACNQGSVVASGSPAMTGQDHYQI